jgi:hypothetical protein
MARACSICARSDAGALRDLLAGGRSARSVAAELRLSHRALLRHAANHLARPLDPQRVADLPQAASGLDPLDELVAALRAQALAGSPPIVHQYRLALAAQQTARHAASSTRALADEPEWIELRARILRLLEPFAEARLAVADGLGVG